MKFSRPETLEALARLPLIDAEEPALVLGKPPVTVHRTLTGLLKDNLAHRMSHAAAHQTG